MRHLTITFAVALAGAVVLSAAVPIGSVTSGETFTLRGHTVPAAGIPNWPVMVGDVIATTTSPAVVQFRDGSRAMLATNTRAKIEQGNGTAVLRVESGSAAFRSSPRPKVTFYMAGNSVAAPVATYSPMISFAAAPQPVAMPAISTAARATPKRPLSQR